MDRQSILPLIQLEIQTNTNNNVTLTVFIEDSVRLPLVLLHSASLTMDLVQEMSLYSKSNHTDITFILTFTPLDNFITIIVYQRIILYKNHNKSFTINFFYVNFKFTITLWQ